MAKYKVRRNIPIQRRRRGRKVITKQDAIELHKKRMWPEGMPVNALHPDNDQIMAWCPPGTYECEPGQWVCPTVIFNPSGNVETEGGYGSTTTSCECCGPDFGKQRV